MIPKDSVGYTALYQPLSSNSLPEIHNHCQVKFAMSQRNLEEIITKCQRFQLTKRSLYPQHIFSHSKIAHDSKETLSHEYRSHINLFVAVLWLQYRASLIQNLLLQYKFNLFTEEQVSRQSQTNFKQNQLPYWKWDMLSNVMGRLQQLIILSKTEPTVRELRDQEMSRFFGHKGRKEEEEILAIAKLVIRHTRSIPQIFNDKELILKKFKNKEFFEKLCREVTQKCVDNYDVNIRFLLDGIPTKLSQDLPTFFIPLIEKINKEHVNGRKMTEIADRCEILNRATEECMQLFQKISKVGKKRYLKYEKNLGNITSFFTIAMSTDFKQLALQNIEKLKNKLKNEEFEPAARQAISTILDALEQMANNNIYLSSFMDPIWTVLRNIIMNHPISLQKKLNYHPISKIKTMKINNNRPKKYREKKPESVAGNQQQYVKSIRNITNSRTTGRISMRTVQYSGQEMLHQHVQWLSIRNGNLQTTSINLYEREFNSNWNEVPENIRNLSYVFKEFLSSIESKPLMIDIASIARMSMTFEDWPSLPLNKLQNIRPILAAVRNLYGTSVAKSVMDDQEQQSQISFLTDASEQIQQSGEETLYSSEDEKSHKPLGKPKYVEIQEVKKPKPKKSISIEQF